MSLFLKERTEARQLFPTPVNGAVVQETPPCLSWLTETSPCPVTVQVFDASTKAVVNSSIVILLLDVVLTNLMLN